MEAQRKAFLSLGDGVIQLPGAPVDCLTHDLVTAKLAAYGFSNKILELLYSYLSNREQRVKINSTFSD